MRRLARLVSLAAVVILLIPVPEAAAQAGGWSAPVRIGTSNLNANYANNVSLASSGHALAQGVAVWTDPATQSIFYVVRRNGTWSATRPLYRAPINAIEELGDARVVVDAGGTATVLWGSVRQGQMQYCYNGRYVYRCPELIAYARASTLAPGAVGWTVPVNVSPKGAYVSQVEAGIDAVGRVVASWVLRPTRTSGFTLQAARKSGAWTAAVSIRTAPAIFPAQLAVGASGDAVVVWAENQSLPAPLGSVNASFLGAASEAWTPTEVVAALPAPVGHLRAAVDGAGRATAIWNDSAAIDIASRDAGGWSAPSVLFAGAVSGPEIVADASGRLVIAWIHVGGAPDGTNTVEARVVEPSGLATDTAWTAGANNSPALAVTADGNAVVSWLDELDANVYAATTAPGDVWDAPVQLSTGVTQYAAAWGTTVSVAAGPGTRAHAAWLGIVGTNGQVQILAATRP